MSCAENRGDAVDDAAVDDDDAVDDDGIGVGVETGRVGRRERGRATAAAAVEAVVVHCPCCGIALMKGDGCDSVVCVCGHAFSWSTVLENVVKMKRFQLTFPKNTHVIAAHIIFHGGRVPYNFSTSFSTSFTSFTSLPLPLHLFGEVTGFTSSYHDLSTHPATLTYLHNEDEQLERDGEEEEQVLILAECWLEGNRTAVEEEMKKKWKQRYGLSVHQVCGRERCRDEEYRRRVTQRERVDGYTYI